MTGLVTYAPHQSQDAPEKNKYPSTPHNLPSTTGWNRPFRTRAINNKQNLQTISSLLNKKEELAMPSNTLKTKEAAEYLGVSKAFLERDRWAGARVPFIKMGARAVRYRIEDLDKYIESRIRTSTSQKGKGDV